MTPIGVSLDTMARRSRHSLHTSKLFAELHGHGTAAQAQADRDDNKDASSFPLMEEKRGYDHSEREKTRPEAAEHGIVVGWLYEICWDLYCLLRLILTLSFLLSTGLSVGVFLAFFFTNTQSAVPVPLFAFLSSFPIAFGISAALRRRERALNDVGVIKSEALMLWFGARDFAPPTVDQEALKQCIGHIRQSLGTFLLVARQTFTHASPSPASQIYRAVDNLHLYLRELGRLDDNFRRGPMFGRLMQRLQVMLDAFERTLVVHSYRSPSVFRAYSMIVVTLAACIFSPVYSLYAHRHGIWIGLYLAILTGAMYSMLVSIYFSEEDPFDGSGLDDVGLRRLGNHSDHFFMHLPVGETPDEPPHDVRLPVDAQQA